MPTINPFRKDFPILTTRVDNHPLVYLDNASTTQKPQSVIDAISNFYKTTNANIHRGLHTLSEQATLQCNAVRQRIKAFIGASDSAEIIFTYGTTMGINLVAYTWAEKYMNEGDEIIISLMEHHANIVPWQELAKRKKIRLLFAPLTTNRELDYTALNKLTSKKTKLIAITHISNVLGIKNNIEKIATIAKKVKAKVLVDAAQSIAHEHINVSQLGIDFLVFSGHKMYGPTGTGVLYAKHELLNAMPPFLTGGDMILEVTLEKTVYQDPPARFEAGTPHISGIVGLGQAVRYLQEKGMNRIKHHERELTAYAYDKLSAIQNITLYSPRKTNCILSFNIKGIHAHDIAEIANRFGVAIRSGNHCAMPLHEYLGTPLSARVSIACYNTRQDIDTFITAIKEAQRIFA